MNIFDKKHGKIGYFYRRKKGLYSESLELPSLTEPNRIKHEFAESELFQ